MSKLAHVMRSLRYFRTKRNEKLVEENAKLLREIKSLKDSLMVQMSMMEKTKEQTIQEAINILCSSQTMVGALIQLREELVQLKENKARQ